MIGRQNASASMSVWYHRFKSMSFHVHHILIKFAATSHTKSLAFSKHNVACLHALFMSSKSSFTRMSENVSFSSVPPTLTNFECATFKNFLMSDARWPLTLVHIAKMLASLVFPRSKKKSPLSQSNLLLRVHPGGYCATWQDSCVFFWRWTHGRWARTGAKNGHPSLRSRQRWRRVSRWLASDVSLNAQK